MEPSIVYSSVSQQSEGRDDTDSLVDDDDDDETQESRDYSKAMHNVIGKKPTRFGRKQIIIASLVLFLLSAVAVGVALLIVSRDSKKLPVERPSTERPPETNTPSSHSSPTVFASTSGLSSLPFLMTSPSSNSSVNTGTGASPSAPSSTPNGTTPVPLSTPGPSPFGLCWKGDSDCPVCPVGHNESFTTLILLNSSEIIQSVERSQKLMNDTDGKDVIEYRSLLTLHTSLNYFCCHTSDEKRQIFEILDNLTWTPVNITYNATSCNLDHDNVTIYMLALLSNSSQDFLFNFVRRIENDMNAQGIPVNNPRKQPFHLTLALVNHSFPVDEVVEQLHHDIPVYGSIQFDHFYIYEGSRVFTPSNSR